MRVNSITKGTILVTIVSNVLLCCAAESTDIRTDWAARQKRCRSFQFEWEALVTYVEDGQEDMSELYRLELSLLVDGNIVRYSTRGMRLVDGTLTDMPYTSIFNDGRLTTHFGKGQKKASPFGRSLGHLENAQFAEKRNYDVEPLMMHFRILPESLSAIDCNRIRVTEEEAFVDGRKCRVIELPDISQPSRWLLWIDRKRESSVVRYAVYLHDRLLRECDITYYRDEEYQEWIPREWNTTVFRGGRVARALKATVSQWNINPQVDAAEFEYTFPVDTLVTDRTGGSDPTVYVLREDGRRRMVTNEEQLAGATYQELVRTETGMAVRNQARAQWRILLLVAVGTGGSGLILLIAILVRRRFRYPAKGGQT